MSRTAARPDPRVEPRANPTEAPVGAEPVRRAVRLDAALCAAADDAAVGAHRTVPRQLEYWARLGRLLEARLGAVQATDLLAGRIVLESVSLSSTVRIDPDRMLAALDRDRADGTLAAAVTRGADVVYDTDPCAPGRLRRTLADGSSSHGAFVDGTFVETMHDAGTRDGAPAESRSVDPSAPRVG